MFLFGYHSSELANTNTLEREEDNQSYEALYGDFALIEKVNELNELKNLALEAENIH